MKALLGVQSHYSFHWGTAAPTAWLERAAALGYRWLGITDHAALQGLPEIVRSAAAGPVGFLVGASFPSSDGRLVMAFVATAEGYGNLCGRITAWLAASAARPAAAAGGIPALDPAAAREQFAGGDRSVGLAFLVDDMAIWDALRRAGAETYWRIGPDLTAPPAAVPADALVFAPGPLMLAPDDFTTHRLLRAIGGGITLDQLPEAPAVGRDPAPVLIARPEEYLRRPEEYRSRFAVYAAAIDRADRLAERLAAFQPDQRIHCPPTPETGGDYAPDETAIARLRRLAYDGAAIRYGTVDAAVRARLDHELALIEKKRFSEYFLVVHDIANRLAGGDGRIHRGRSITCGRGSGAASLVNYCLGVTNVDVMKHDLMFERFLNDARSDPPDIDVDFAWDERDDLLERVLDSYGHSRVARVANHNRYDWRGAFRATARTLGFADAEITRRLRQPNGGSVLPAGHPPPATVPVVARARERSGLARRDGDDGWNLARELSRRLIDLPYCLSMHCGGVVISPGDLSRTVPLFLSRKGLPTIQWEKEGAEEMGLVKIDLLGNRSLAVIRDAIRDVSRSTGIPEGEVIAGDPTDDDATRELLRTGNTFGVFYLESPSMRLLMAKARIGDFRHAVIHSSIIRPAANAFINEYLRRLHGKPWQPEHEKLRGLFDESYGIPVYQEDVVKLTMRLCGYGYSQADRIRKILGKRNAREGIARIFPDLAAAARANGVRDAAVIESFRQTLMSMTGYSFCKPHSASYAQVSFEAAYLRAHYPAAFIAAVLSNGGGYYTVQAYVSEAFRLGLRVLPPDVNASGITWQAEGEGAVRVGLMAIAGLSRTAMERVTGDRERAGLYAGLDDFFGRTALPAEDLRRLALVGALDALAPDLTRPQLLWYAAQSGRVTAPRPASGSGLDGALFAETAVADQPGRRSRTPPALAAYTVEQRRQTEFAMLGFITDCHPLALFADAIRRDAAPLRRRSRPRLTRISRLCRHVGALVTVIAWPITAKIVETKHGDKMMFQTFEDGEALCEAVVFPEEFRTYHRYLASVQPLWLTGRVLREFGVVTLQILAVHPLARASRSGKLPEAPVPCFGQP